jgi:hypothetical protein
MLWSKQFYHYIVEQWLEGDPAFQPPPEERKHGRNFGWRHLYNERVMSMPDKWDFHGMHPGTLPFIAFRLRWSMRTLRRVSSISLRANGTSIRTARYPHTSGILAMLIHPLSRGRPGAFTGSNENRLGEVIVRSWKLFFHKMLIAFTWWVNRKDSEGNNIFQGGFLGLDNIGVFDRNVDVPRRQPPRAKRWYKLDGNVLPQHAAHCAGARP